MEGILGNYFILIMHFIYSIYYCQDFDVMQLDFIDRYPEAFCAFQDWIIGLEW